MTLTANALVVAMLSTQACASATAALTVVVKVVAVVNRFTKTVDARRAAMTQRRTSRGEFN